MKATKSIFAQLGRFKDLSYDIGDGETLEVRINTLTLGDIVDIDNMEEGSKELELIVRSVQKSIPDITADDIRELPLSITQPLVEDICEFNGIELPSDEDGGDDQ